VTSKAAYVQSQGQDRPHTCHWPGCAHQVPPSMWGCKGHWFTPPADIRAAIWRAYQPGQEKTMRPSGAYVSAAQEAQAWIQDYLANRAAVKPPTAASQQSRAIDHKTIDLFGGPNEK
jgi:hypothetical protein